MFQKHFLSNAVAGTPYEVDPELAYEGYPLYKEGLSTVRAQGVAKGIAEEKYSGKYFNCKDSCR